MIWQIRLAQPADTVALHACARAAFEGYVPRMNRAPAPMSADLTAPIACREVHVACAPDGAALGFVLCRVAGDEMLLDTLAVWPAQAGRGIGRSLVAHIEGLAHAQGLRAITLYTNAAMVENLRFYARLGYVSTGRRLQDGFDRVFFRKALG